MVLPRPRVLRAGIRPGRVFPRALQVRSHPVRGVPQEVGSQVRSHPVSGAAGSHAEKPAGRGNPGRDNSSEHYAARCPARCPASCSNDIMEACFGAVRYQEIGSLRSTNLYFRFPVHKLYLALNHCHILIRVIEIHRKCTTTGVSQLERTSK